MTRKKRSPSAHQLDISKLVADNGASASDSQQVTLEEDSPPIPWWIPILYRWITILCSIYSVIYTPFDLAFFDKTPKEVYIADMTIGYILLIDVIIRVWRDWPRDWWMWIRPVAEFSACIYPCLYPGPLGRPWEGEYSAWLRYAGCIRIARLYPLIELDRELLQRFRLIRFMVYELSWCHLVACVFHHCARFAPDSSQTWIGSLHDSIPRAYITSMYSAATTTSTLGFGDMRPQGPIEEAVLFCIIFINKAIAANLMRGFFATIAPRLPVAAQSAVAPQPTATSESTAAS